MSQPSPREKSGVYAIGIALIFIGFVPVLCLLAGCPGPMSSTSGPSGSAGASESCQDRVRYIPQHSNGVWGHCSTMASQYEAEKEQWRVFDGRLTKDGYGHEVGCGATETEALVAALETAAAALGGGQ